MAVMDRLWAQRTDYHLFGVGVPRGGGLGAILRCTVYGCPYCRWIFKTTWGILSPLLGPGDRECRHCKLKSLNPSKEWPEMGGDERQRFLLPVLVSGYRAAFILIGALWVYSVFALKMQIALKISAFFLAFLFPVVSWCSFRVVQVLCSVHRYNAREKTPAT
jgi:hypothetical protein